MIQEQIWKSRNRVPFGSECLPGIFNILFVCFLKKKLISFFFSSSPKFFFKSILVNCASVHSGDPDFLYMMG